MSRKKSNVTILGPDGKPINLASMRTKAHEASVAAQPKLDVSGIDVGTYEWSSRMEGSPLIPNHSDADKRQEARKNTSKPKPLADRVAADVASLTADFDGIGGVELPKPERDLTTYDDAFAAARELCPHDDIEDTMHALGQVFCRDCARYMTTAQYLNDRKKRSAGGSLFRRWFGG